MSTSLPARWTATELAQAVVRGQFELHYQPIVDLRSDQIVGAEALLRWRHPQLGLLPPGQFLPVVESSGLMPEIGAWVLGTACRQMREWRMLAWQPFRLAVNVSASQVGPDFDGWVKGVLADAELPAEYLEIELTESSIFEDVERIIEIGQTLRNYGFKVSMDDFGSGYSSINLLGNLPLDVIKMDKGFFNSNLQREQNHIVVEATIKMIKKLGMTVVAEGIESETEVDMLRALGCDIIQGYYFGKPMPVYEFEEQIF